MRNSKELVRDLWRATKEGFPTGRKLFLSVFQGVLVVIAVFGISIAPWQIPEIGNPFTRTVAWVVVIAILAAAAISLGLTPFFGQRRITQGAAAQRNEETTALVDQVHALTEELKPLRVLYQSQRGHEDEFLHLVVEELNLSVRQSSEEDVFFLKFQIDSGLVYEWRPYRLEVRVVVNGAAPTEPWDLTPTPNLLPGRRTQLDTKMIPIKGDKLRLMIVTARKEHNTSAHVDILIVTQQGASPFTLRSPETFYIVR